MRQQDGRQPGIGLGTVRLGPRQLGGGVTRQDRIAGQCDGLGRTAHGVHDLRTLGGRAGVAPQLRRGQHLAIGIDRHETVLLAGHGQRRDARAHRRIDAGEAGLHRGHPVGGVLFAAAVVPADQVERYAGAGHEGARGGVVHHHFQALRTCIDAGDEAHAVSFFMRAPARRCAAARWPTPRRRVRCRASGPHGPTHSGRPCPNAASRAPAVLPSM